MKLERQYSIQDEARPKQDISGPYLVMIARGPEKIHLA